MNTDTKLNNNTYNVIAEKVDDCKLNGNCNPNLYRIINEVYQNTTHIYRFNDMQDYKNINANLAVQSAGYYSIDGTFVSSE